MNRRLLCMFVRRLAVVAAMVAGCNAAPTGLAPGFQPTGNHSSLLAETDETSELEADAPPECADAKLARAFAKGHDKGAKLVTKAWKRVADCNRVDEFADQLLSDLAELMPEPDSDKARKLCKYSGGMAGVFAQLDVVQQVCAAKCFMDGDLVGAIEAKAYCDLAIDAEGDLDPEPWIRSPVSICGLEFEVGCDSQFLNTTTTYVSPVGVCIPYTTAPYGDLWNRSRLRSCDYNQQGQQNP